MSVYTITIQDTPKGVSITFQAEGEPNTPARVITERLRAFLKEKPGGKPAKKPRNSRRH